MFSISYSRVKSKYATVQFFFLLLQHSPHASLKSSVQFSSDSMKGRKKNANLVHYSNDDDDEIDIHPELEIQNNPLI